MSRKFHKEPIVRFYDQLNIVNNNVSIVNTSFNFDKNNQLEVLKSKLDTFILNNVNNIDKMDHKELKKLTDDYVDKLQSLIINKNDSDEDCKKDQEIEVGNRKKPIRVYLDGCFDLMHAGHYNAVRQAKSLGDVLVLGIHSDEEITRCKGPPVMNNQERLNVVKACKWIDEICFGVPYAPTIQLLDQLNCDFVVHGDDIAAGPDGVDVYKELKEANRMSIVKRTAGVSTTDLVNRLLTNNEQHTDNSSKNKISSFVTTTWRLSQFSNNKIPNHNDTIVYVAGDFDLFHIGHIDFLRDVSALGSFLYVGVYDDDITEKLIGNNRPVMGLHERVMNILSCKFVDEVVIGAPLNVSSDFLTLLNIKIVAIEEGSDLSLYQVPISKNINIFIKSPSLNTNNVVDRILSNRSAYEKRNLNRMKKEVDYIEHRQYVQEI